MLVDSHMALFGDPGTVTVQSDPDSRTYYSRTKSGATSFTAADHRHAPAPYTRVKWSTGHSADP